MEDEGVSVVPKGKYDTCPMHSDLSIRSYHHEFLEPPPSR